MCCLSTWAAPPPRRRQCVVANPLSRTSSGSANLPVWATGAARGCRSKRRSSIWPRSVPAAVRSPGSIAAGPCRSVLNQPAPFPGPPATGEGATSVASAIGLVAADPTVTQVRTTVIDASAADPDSVNEWFTDLEGRAAKALECDLEAITFHRTIDARYPGQVHQLGVPVHAGVL